MIDPIVGIDLGTSNSVVAFADDAGTVRVLADEAGYKIHPSVVSFHPNGGVVVGAAAKQRKVIDPKNTIYSAKRLIGRSYNSPETQIAKQRAPFEIKEGANQQPIIVTRGGEFAVPEISAIVLDHVRNVATSQLQTDVSRAVVTVPAAFSDAQRSATATAGAIAGLTIVRVLNEPTAAALAYGHTRNLREIIAVYDFGGGTFDITILKLEEQVYEVLGTSGDTFLGGDDLDERLVDRMVEKFLTENRVDLRTNEVSMMRLRAVAEQTKIELSRRSRAVVRVDEIAYGAKGKPLDLQIEITRDEFVRQCADIIDRTFPVCQESLAVAGLDISQINDVILVGGTTKIPYVRDQVTKFFAKAPRTDVSPEDAVALGAALQATSLDRILKRKAPSRTMAARIDATFGDDGDTNSQTQESDALDDSSITTPGAEMPLPQIGDALDLLDVTEFGAESPDQPKRKTDGYAAAKPRPEDLRATERPVTRGAAVDHFDDRTPASAAPIGRITKPVVSAPLPEFPRSAKQPAPLPPAPPAPMRTVTGVPLQRPPARPAPPAPPMPPAPPPPTAAPHAATLMLEPLAAITTPGFAPMPADTDLGFAPLTDVGIEESAASTAKGFAPPQTYPVMAAARPPIVLDVTPRGLGIGTVAGYCEELIRRNSRVPAEIRKLFTTSRDSQEMVRIIVCQGESRRLEANLVIGDLVLDNLPPRPRGETSIEVSFMLDASGILRIHARDAQTGKEQRAELDLVGAMPEADVAASRDRLNSLRR